MTDQAISYHLDGSQPQPHQIFVSGSNLSGNLGVAPAGTMTLLRCGAIWGRRHGVAGNSHAHKPTTNKSVIISLSVITAFVAEFTRHATDNPSLQFFMTRIGCGLVGLSDEQIAPMFYPPLPNVDYPTNWQPYLNESTRLLK